jgi:hypothetical protein
MAYKGTDMITTWLEGQGPELEQEFRLFVQKNFHKKPAIQAWLNEHGLEVKSLSVVYKWVSKNAVPGDQARLFNADCEEYTGIELIPAMEKIMAQLVRVSQAFIDKIENSTITEIPLEEAMRSLPNYAREIRTLAEQIEKTSKFRDIQSLGLDGAARVYEIMMQTPGIRDTSIEDFIRRALEAAICQLQDEIEKTPVK